MNRSVQLMEHAVKKCKLSFDYEYKTDVSLSFRPKFAFGKEPQHGFYVCEINAKISDKSKRRCFSMEISIIGIFVAEEKLKDPEEVKECKADMLFEVYLILKNYVKNLAEMSGMPEVILPDVDFNEIEYSGEIK